VATPAAALPPMNAVLRNVRRVSGPCVLLLAVLAGSPANETARGKRPARPRCMRCLEPTPNGRFRGTPPSPRDPGGTEGRLRTGVRADACARRTRPRRVRSAVHHAGTARAPRAGTDARAGARDLLLLGLREGPLELLGLLRLGLEGRLGLLELGLGGPGSWSRAGLRAPRTSGTPRASPSPRPRPSRPAPTAIPTWHSRCPIR
jgi:hypothetical protein